MPIGDHRCGLSWDTAHHQQVLPPVKEASAVLLGPLPPEDAFEPYKVSMAISACWPGEKWVVPEAAALKSGKAHSFWELIGPERFACYCEVQRGRQIWKLQGSILARVQGHNQQEIPAKLLSVMSRHCWKRLWPAEQISHHCTQYDRKCYYPNQTRH